MAFGTVGAMLLTLPIVDKTGYRLQCFGVLPVKLLEIEMIAPPVGMNVLSLKVSWEKSPHLVRCFLASSVLWESILWSLPQ